MILRSITRHVREQNWFAVWLDLVIVGIFVGLEISNWNETRKLAVQENFFLEQVDEEIDHNKVALITGASRGIGREQ